MGQKGFDRYENQNQASERKYTNSLKSVYKLITAETTTEYKLAA